MSTSDKVLLIVVGLVVVFIITAILHAIAFYVACALVGLFFIALLVKTDNKDDEEQSDN